MHGERLSVDYYLDVVNNLTDENESLRTKLDAAEDRIAALERELGRLYLNNRVEDARRRI